MDVTAAVLTSLIATPKRHHIDPFAYLRELFACVSAHPENRIEELSPDQWLAAWPSATLIRRKRQANHLFTRAIQC